MNIQRSFLDDDYQSTPAKKLARRDDPSTSKEAAKSIEPTGLELKALEAIAAAGHDGCISDDVRRYCVEEFKITAYSSVTARYKALHEKGLIEFDGTTRPGDSGRQQRVMKVTPFGRVKLQNVSR
jgi:hypothetical protein